MLYNTTEPPLIYGYERRALLENDVAYLENPIGFGESWIASLSMQIPSMSSFRPGVKSVDKTERSRSRVRRIDRV